MKGAFLRRPIAFQGPRWSALVLGSGRNPCSARKIPCAFPAPPAKIPCSPAQGILPQDPQIKSLSGERGGEKGPKSLQIRCPQGIFRLIRACNVQEPFHVDRRAFVAPDS